MPFARLQPWLRYNAVATPAFVLRLLSDADVHASRCERRGRHTWRPRSRWRHRWVQSELLRQAPQLAYAIFQDLLLMNLVDYSTLGTVVEQAAQPAIRNSICMIDIAMGLGRLGARAKMERSFQDRMTSSASRCLSALHS